MKINEIIKERRLELGYTQEQLGALLNLSSSAVNRWEKGNCYPDITILPILARILKTDLNTLLSFKEDLTDMEIGLFLNELANKEIDEAFLLAKNKIDEYPTCYKLLLNCAAVLKGMLCIEDRQVDETYYPTIEKWILDSLKSDDLQIRNSAKSMMIDNYLKNNQLDLAKEMIESLPEQNVIDKHQKMISLYRIQGDNDLALKLTEEKLYQQISNILALLTQMIEISFEQNNEHAYNYYAKVYKQVGKCFDLANYLPYLGMLQVAILKKDEKASISILKKMFTVLFENENFLTSPLYSHLTIKVTKQGLVKEAKELFSTLLKDKDFDFLKENEDFTQMLKRI